MGVWTALAIAGGAVAVMALIMLRAFELITRLQQWLLLSALLGAGAFWAQWGVRPVPEALLTSFLVVPAVIGVMILYQRYRWEANL